MVVPVSISRRVSLDTPEQLVLRLADLIGLVAYAMTEYAAAKAELEKIFRQLERINPSAARSLEEGMEETLTVHRLGVGERLRRTLASTNPIESCLSTVETLSSVSA